jgi:hypothetical protein
MGCGCNKQPRGVAARQPTRMPNQNFNSSPEKVTDTVPTQTMAITNNRVTALNQTKANVQNKFMNPERLRIEKIRRDAIRNALGKE